MRKYLLALSATAALVSGPALADKRDGVPALDHVFVLVLENRNAFTSFGSTGILDNPAAPHIAALAKQYNFASNYNGVRHPSLPNYLAMITGDWIGTDVIATPHSYPAGSTVGVSDDDSPSVATDYPVPPANGSKHRWKVQLPSLAGQLVSHGKDWRAYLQNLPEAGTSLANWPGDDDSGKVYAVKHNPFPYIEEVQNDPAQFAKQVPLEQLFSDIADGHAPALSFIVPDECRDMHGLSSVLAPCGGVNNTDANDVKRGDDETFWLVNAITGSRTWHKGRNALFVVFDEGNGPLTCGYNPDTKTDLASPNSLLPGADCYDPKNFHDKVLLIAITNYGVRGVVDEHFYSHYSLLKTIEAAFGLPFIGHAKDAGTRTLAPLLAPAD